MAVIRETLSLEDQFSAAFSSYINMADQAAGATKSVSAANRQQTELIGEAAKQSQLSYAEISKQARASAAQSNAAVAASRAQSAAAKAAAQEAASAYSVAIAKAKAMAAESRAAAASARASASVQAQSAATMAASYKTATAKANAMAAEARAAAAALKLQSEKAKAASQSNEKLNRSFSSAATGANTLANSLKALISVAAVKSLLNISDQVANVNARLSMVAGPGESVEGLQAAIMASANRSRANYLDTANSISKMGVMAGDAFSGSAELIGFMEAVNKQFVIAGTSAEGIDAAMLQLTQAMSSGVLRGEELNSVFEQAPNIVQNIADYLGVSVGEIREMASEGKITSEVVKNAMLAATDEINEEFENMPRTWAQVWDRVQNDALEAFQPLFDRLSELANSNEMDDFLDTLEVAMEGVADAGVWLIDTLENGIDVAKDFAPQIAIVVGALAAYKAATLAAAAATAIFNLIASLNPIQIVIILVVALTAAIITLWDNCEGFRDFFVESIKTLFRFTRDTYNFVVDIFNSVYDGTKNFVKGVVGAFYDLGDGVLQGISKAVGALQGLADAYNQFASVIGTPEIDLSKINYGISRAAARLRTEKNVNLAKIEAGFENGVLGFKKLEKSDFTDEEMDKFLNPFKEFTFSGTLSSAFDSLFSDVESSIQEGADTLASILSDLLPEDSGSGYNLEANSLLSDIAGNTASLKKDVSLAQEDVKMLVDMAQREYINNINLQTNAPQITVNATSASGQPIDGKALANKIRDILLQESSASTDKTYSFAF